MKLNVLKRFMRFDYLLREKEGLDKIKIFSLFSHQSKFISSFFFHLNYTVQLENVTQKIQKEEENEQKDKKKKKGKEKRFKPFKEKCKRLNTNQKKKKKLTHSLTHIYKPFYN
ncbi:LOW QUALITY PROTEIN: hypothetical protein TorRG33x02_096810 [Trema orientale]|uniref:Uncharacterized protein n=1 Tax=Trema orientale TaxID=63057 RepID=A0A2P5FA47_TREOI|nr:LOW QUALITY PROTEIN: hypothetical protein TorRG33x02_096810 [Trema orientale]